MEPTSVVGGALLSATFEWLLSKLNSLESELLNSPKQVYANIQYWKSLLPRIGAMLEDAEEKKATLRSVKLWLNDLRDLTYDMDDILEEFEIDAKRAKLIAKSHISTSKSRKLRPRWFKDFITDRKMASKVEDVTGRLQRIAEEINTLGLVSLTIKVGDNSQKVSVERLTETSSLPENNVYGRESDKGAILQLLLEDHEGVSVIPIVGMGGLGKTTLARLVYNDETLEGKFELRAWVCVSDVFDVHRITRAILEQLTGERCDFGNLTFLQERLKAKLFDKKFFLVLDDVWNEKYSQWDNLQRPFMSGTAGSKIIITTRNKVVAKMMTGDDRIYHLELLHDKACLSLLARHALGTENFDAYPNLKGVGIEIVKKCKGLPLAIKTLGGLLRGNLSLDDWEVILNSEMWEISEDKSDILPALRLSYHHLPFHLKRCFVHCAILPKDYEVAPYELVALWMAEGLLQPLPKGMKQMEDVGFQYFHDLLSRSFFQESSRTTCLFVMHDLINDLAKYVTGEICCDREQILDGEKS